MTYIALLRGINVGGSKPVKMEQLSKLFSELGFENIKTYVQGGNVIFTTTKSITPEVIRKNIESAILKSFKFAVPVTVRTSTQWSAILNSNPFLKQKEKDVSKLHVTFLAGIPNKALFKKLDRLSKNKDGFKILGQEIYLYCPDGYGRTALSNNAIEKCLEVGATTRNWNTVKKLHEMSADLG